MKLESNPSPTKNIVIDYGYNLNVTPSSDWKRETEITVTPNENYELLKLVGTFHFLDYSNVGGGGFFGGGLPEDADMDFEIPIVDNKAVFKPNSFIASVDRLELNGTVNELPGRTFRFQLSLTNTSINQEVIIPDINPFALIGEKETIILKSDEGMEFIKPIEIELYDVEKNLIKNFEYNPKDSDKFSEDKTEFNISVEELLEVEIVEPEPEPEVYIAEDKDFQLIDGYWIYKGMPLEVDITNFVNSKNLTSTRSMFSKYSAYDSTPVKRVVLGKNSVTNMLGMFTNTQVTNLDLSSFNTSSVTDMSYMFRDSRATSLDLSSFDTSNVTNMYEMFYNSRATIGYARTQADADKFNSSSNKPEGLVFVVKP